MGGRGIQKTGIAGMSTKQFPRLLFHGIAVRDMYGLEMEMQNPDPSYACSLHHIVHDLSNVCNIRHGTLQGNIMRKMCPVLNVYV